MDWIVKMDLPNERIIELEERMAEITQSEQQKTEKKNCLES